MREYRAPSGGLRPFYTDADVEQMCEDALRQHGYFPPTPERINIDRLVEKRFGVCPEFEPMPDGVFGYSRFGAKGMISMHISQALMEEGTQASDRRVSTTIAHEAGHGLMHAHLFALSATSPLFGNDADVTKEKVLCRNDGERQYDKRWWEIQANMAIGPLLMPKRLVVAAVAPLLVKRGSLGLEELPDGNREDAARLLAGIFDVNPAVARIRLQKIYTPLIAGNLTL